MQEFLEQEVYRDRLLQKLFLKANTGLKIAQELKGRSEKEGALSSLQVSGELRRREVRCVQCRYICWDKRSFVSKIFLTCSSANSIIEYR